MRRFSAVALAGLSVFSAALVVTSLGGGCTTIYNYENYYALDGGSPDAGGSGGEASAVSASSTGGAGGAGGEGSGVGGGGGAGGSQPSVITELHAGFVSPYDIAIDDENVYWSDGLDGVAEGGIHKVRKDGSGYKMLTAIKSPRAIAVDSTHVYFFTSSFVGTALYRVPKAGGVVEELANNFEYGNRITTFDGYVYFSTNDPAIPSGKVWKLPQGAPAGQAATQLVGGMISAPYDVIADVTGVYFLDLGTGTGDIWRMGFNGENAEKIAVNQIQPYHLAKNGSYLYWTTFDCRIIRAKTDGSEQAEIRGKTKTNEKCGDIAADGTRAYFTLDYDIRSLLLPSGNSPLTLATVDTLTQSVAVDDTFVYFTRVGGFGDGVGAIFKATKQ